MLLSGQKILTYCEGMTFDQFIADDKTVDAVIRNFEIIGEAASRVTEDFQKVNIEIPWRQLSGYRNRLIHEYFGVDYTIVWDIIQLELKTLCEELTVVLSSE